MYVLCKPHENGTYDAEKYVIVHDYESHHSMILCKIEIDMPKPVLERILMPDGSSIEHMFQPISNKTKFVPVLRSELPIAELPND